MLFLLIACFLFVFLTLSIGNWLISKIYPDNNIENFSVFEGILAGFVLITTYLNVWSFWLPVNYLSLVPLFLFSICLTNYLKEVTGKLEKFATGLCRSWLAIPAGFTLLLLLAYALIPPQHGDSPGYHFLSIRWNETYKAVFGLANLHGRLGFNSSFFVSSAAFAFSGFAGQPLYIVNIVFTIVFYCWLLQKMNCYGGKMWSLVFLFVAVAMFRQLLDSISSPTPDILATIINTYVFISIVEARLIDIQLNQRRLVVFILLICFALTVKLSSFPLVLVALLLGLHQKIYKNRKSLQALFIGGVVILVPWLTRNFILTGYFIFPVSATGFIHPDWQVPSDILHWEKLLINNGPKLIGQDWKAIDKLSFFKWFPLWLAAHANQGLLFSLFILGGALLSSFFTFMLVSPKQYPFLFWLNSLTVVAIFFWIYNSPDYRFGYPYLINAFVLLLMYLAKNRSLPIILQRIMVVVFVLLCVYYIRPALEILAPKSVSSFAIKPLQAPQYDPTNQTTTFPFVQMKDKVRLYVEDKEHYCNMAPLPCLIPYNNNFPTHQIRLRGTKVEDGFKILRK